MREFWNRLRGWVKVCIVCLLIAAIAVPVICIHSWSNSSSKSDETEVAETTNSKDSGNIKDTADKDTSSGETVHMDISLDEWIGWKSLLDANGGLETTPDSINAKNGISVTYHIINDASESSKMLMTGELNAAGYTVNRYAFLNNQFTEGKTDVKMVYVTNYSNGGDGIIANDSITSINDLVGKKIAVSQYSEAQTLVEWLVMNSGLSESDKESIRSGYQYVETADEAAELFFAGKVDAAATWEPYLTEAENTAGAHRFFSTAEATNLVLDGIVFRQDFLDKYGDAVTTLIKGSLEAADMYTTDFTAIREMPMFAEMSEEDIIDTASGAKLATWTDNESLLTEGAVSMYKDMSNIWLSLGEAANPKAATTAFDSTYMDALESTFKEADAEAAETEEATVDTTVTEDNAEEIENKAALLERQVTINFTPDEATFLDPDSAYEALDEFVEIAKVLNNVYIEIDGNTNDVGGGPSSGMELSLKRANTVKAYLVSQGISANRILTVGNGASKPWGDGTDESMNRRTDIYFKSGM